MREVCEAERNWCVQSSLLIGQQQENKTNLCNRSSGVQISRDICTRFGRHFNSTKCSWIITYFISVCISAVIDIVGIVSKETGAASCVGGELKHSKLG